MRNHLSAWALVLAAFSLAASGQDWKAKQYPEWTDNDAKEVLTDSPWAKSVTPTLVGAASAASGAPKRKRRKGAVGAQATTQPAKPPEAAAIPKLSVRWESAQPMQEAGRKASPGVIQVLSPSEIDRDHYVVAVFGIPGRLLTLGAESNPKKAAAKAKAQIRKLKKLAFIKSVGRRDIEASIVTIKIEGDSAVIVYSFSKKDEIIWREHKLSFEAQIANLKILQTFNTDDMTLHGKLEL